MVFLFCKVLERIGRDIVRNIFECSIIDNYWFLFYVYVYVLNNNRLKFLWVLELGGWMRVVVWCGLDGNGGWENCRKFFFRK